MGIIRGRVTNRFAEPLVDVNVFVMNHGFEPVFHAQTDESGAFCLDVPAGAYPFFVAVKDYGEKYLEYWCNDIVLREELELNCQIDTLEVYGLNLFEIKGAASAFTVYFRPMSLEKFLLKQTDIAPELTEESLTCLVNGVKCDVLVMNRMKEYTQDGLLTAYLIQIAKPSDLTTRNKLDLKIQDAWGNMGMASLFFAANP